MLKHGTRRYTGFNNQFHAFNEFLKSIFSSDGPILSCYSNTDCDRGKCLCCKATPEWHTAAQTSGTRILGFAVPLVGFPHGLHSLQRMCNCHIIVSDTIVALTQLWHNKCRHLHNCCCDMRQQQSHWLVWGVEFNILLDPPLFCPVPDYKVGG